MFATTRWSLVQAAGGERSTPAREALGTLCETYWFPLYAFARRRGLSPVEAEDRTQSFFAFVLEGNVIAKADPERGRFRSFLLKSLQNFLVAEQRRDDAQKRGGGRIIQSFDVAQAESRYAQEPASNETPERLFERQWALTVLQTTMDKLRAEYRSEGRGELCESLERHLHGDETRLPYIELAARFGLSEEAIKSAAHRLRRRYRELLRAEVAETLTDPKEVDDELRSLMEAVAT
jgi:RNA polymerase sigma factor (sigma-70 family)